jgi:hypothetical protein
MMRLVTVQDLQRGRYYRISYSSQKKGRVVVYGRFDVVVIHSPGLLKAVAHYSFTVEDEKGKEFPIQFDLETLTSPQTQILEVDCDLA